MKTLRIQGFTLIETAIVLIIAGLFMVGLVKIYEQHLIEKRESQFVKTTNAITSALAFYIQDTGFIIKPDGTTATKAADDIAATGGLDESRDPTRYPCPASPTLSPNDVDYGVEQRNPNTGRCRATAANGIVALGVSPNRVYYGSVPAVTLGLSTRDMYDPNYNRFTYAVSERVSDSRWNGDIVGSVPARPRPDGGALGEGENPPGSIVVEKLDDAGAVTATYNTVQFAIIAHGDNAGGAYNIEGNLVRPCDVGNTGRDFENCDFLTAAADNNLLDSAEFRSTNSNDASWYDDTVIYSLRGVNDKDDYWALGQLDSTDVVMLNTGNVGIGVAAPGEKIDVAGRVRAQSFLHGSDKRLKENVEPLQQDTLKKLENIDIVTYDYIDTPEKHKKIGVIAQDLQKIYPEFVFEGKNGFLSVDYVSLTGPIIKGLQELSEEKDKEIYRLNKELTDISKRLETLENKEE